jgi:hypothetical protein
LLCDHIECVQVCVERLLCFCGRAVAVRAEQSAVVVPIDPCEGFPFAVRHRFSGVDLADNLGLKEADPAFCQGIIVGTASGSDREIDLGFGQAPGILDGQIFGAAIRMVDRALVIRRFLECLIGSVATITIDLLSAPVAASNYVIKGKTAISHKYFGGMQASEGI